MLIGACKENLCLMVHHILSGEACNMLWTWLFWIYSLIPMKFEVIYSRHFKLSGIGMQQMKRSPSNKIHTTWSKHNNFFLVQFAIKPKWLLTCYTDLIKLRALILHIAIDWISKRNTSSLGSITTNPAYNSFVSPNRWSTMSIMICSSSCKL